MVHICGTGGFGRSHPQNGCVDVDAGNDVVLFRLSSRHVFLVLNDVVGIVRSAVWRERDVYCVSSGQIVSDGLPHGVER